MVIFKSKEFCCWSILNSNLDLIPKMTGTENKSICTIFRSTYLRTLGKVRKLLIFCSYYTFLDKYFIHEKWILLYISVIRGSTVVQLVIFVVGYFKGSFLNFVNLVWESTRPYSNTFFF